MAAPTVVQGDWIFAGSVTFAGTQTNKAGSIRDADVASNAGIQATKLEGEFSEHLSQTGTVIAATQYLGIIRGVTGDIISLQGVITETIATGADRTVTVDLLKSTGAGAFASVLTSTLVFNNASVLRTVTTAVLDSTKTPLVAGDHLKLTVAVAGAAGAQALGLSLRVIWREDAS